MKHQHQHHNNHQPTSSTTASSPSDASTSTQPPSLTTASPEPPSTSSTSSDDPTTSSPWSQGGGESISVVKRGENAAVCRWTIAKFTKQKARALWSKYFAVGGYDCRLLAYPKGDSQALPGYISLYLQVVDPRNSSKWECFSSYRLSILNCNDECGSISRDSWHRFSSKKKSHGWCDFTPSNLLLDPRAGYLLLTNNSDSIIISADILILNETVTFVKDISLAHTLQCSTAGGGDSASGSNADIVGGGAEVLSGKFTWKVRNFSLFKEMIKTQKIMSPGFQAGECSLRISVYQSTVNGVEYLSMCLESKDTEKVSGGGSGVDRSCWCLFRISVLNQRQGLNHMQRDSYGRFAADNKSGDNTSLGWNDYMKMSDFVGGEAGFLVDDTAVFSTSFHVIKEFSSFSKTGGVPGVRTGFGGGGKKSDGHSGKFTWRIDNFTRLKDLLKKRKITGLCIKSRRFQIGNRDCRLIVYPRGQSQPPCHLSVFLEVTDSRNTSSDWSCFVSHKLSVLNQKVEEKSVTKESQNRYSKAAKDWGWREFVTLTSLFDQDSGFLVQDSVIFSAEVLILKETSIMEEFSENNAEIDAGKKSSFTWKVENFLSFKEIMETRKIFSKFFQAGGCELRIGVYESFDTVCIYLESDQSAGTDPDKNFWVRYRMAVVNQKNPAKTVWKESSICTKTWNNSVLQFMKVSDVLEPEAGFLLRDTVVFVCEILDCCPWFEFSDLEFLASEDDQDALTTDPDELMDSEDSEGISGDEEDIFRNLLSQAGFHLSYGDNPSQPQVTLREKLLMDAGAIAGFLTGLRVYLDDPAKVKRLLLPTKLSGTNDGKKAFKSDETSPSLMNLLMGVKVLQQAIIDLLLDIMVECCQPSEGSSNDDAISKASQACSSASPQSFETQSGATEHTRDPLMERLDTEASESVSVAVQSMRSSTGTSDAKVHEQAVPGQPTCPPESSAGGLSEEASLRPKTKWPEQSEELLGLIVNSLRALDGAVPQGCPEPRRRPQSAQKITLVMDKAPKHLQPDLVALVPKLVERSEHPLAAAALLERLQKADAEPALRIPVFGALSQLECSSEVWEGILFQSVALLADSNDEPLAATINFLFKAATQCQHLPEAVRSVRVRLKQLGPEVSSCVLEFLTRTVHNWADASEAILRDIDSDDDCGLNCSSLPDGVFLFGENGPPSEILNVVNEHSFCGSHHFSDIYLLMEMLSIPCLAVDALQTFERAVARGAILAPSVAMVLDRRHTQSASCNTRVVAEAVPHTDTIVEGEVSDQLRGIHDDFTMLLGLAETLALSADPCVKGFVKLLYTILFKWYADDSYRGRILKRLVDRATSCTDNTRDLDFDMEILILLCEEQEIIRPVMSMMREAVELANVDRAALWHQLCSSEDEIIRLREEQKAEVSKLVEEKALISQKLIDSESANSRLKSDMKTEMDRFAREKKEVAEQLQAMERQLEWLRAERGEETAKLAAEKRTLQDRLHDAEVQLAQLKTRKRDELKKVVKEKNALAERLKNAEAARKRFDEELKRYATENVTREEIRQSLEDEVRRLTQTVGQTEGEKREKEEQVARCEAYIDGMESKLEACQQYIHTLEGSLQEEMSRHAPLYGAGLEDLSMKELETLARIHEEGLRQIHALQHQRKGPLPNTSLVSSLGLPLSFFPNSLPHSPPPPPSSMPVGLPHSLISNGSSMHNNGHVNGGVGPWFNPS
ncbi:hypothetical protein vseg_005639 [Gypsophila vaccaria]